jgi:hypothetical protein
MNNIISYLLRRLTGELRYSEIDKIAIIHSILKLIKDHEDTLFRKFTVVTKNKIRIREI